MFYISAMTLCFINFNGQKTYILEIFFPFLNLFFLSDWIWL